MVPRFVLALVTYLVLSLVLAFVFGRGPALIQVPVLRMFPATEPARALVLLLGLVLVLICLPCTGAGNTFACAATCTGTCACWC